MKKPTVIFIVSFLLFNLLMLVPQPLSWTATTNALRYGMDTNLGSVDASFIANNTSEQIGFSVAVAGDVNGDGLDDILIGAPYNDSGLGDEGKVYLFFGRSSGWSMDLNIANADASFIGEDWLDWAGSSVAGAGDVNNDTYDDFLIAAPGSDDGANNAGEVYLILGNKTGWALNTSLSLADASFLGETTAAGAGGQKPGFGPTNGVDGAGDVNDDGYDDILIGAARASGTAGKTYIIFGKASGWTQNIDLSLADASFIGENNLDLSGKWVAGVGNLNGDRFDDILIGAEANDDGGDNSGKAYIIFGKATGWSTDVDLSNADASFIGMNEQAGFSVAGAGDVNGDGLDDILIGAPMNDTGGTNAGKVFLIFGNTTGWLLNTKLSSVNTSFIAEQAFNMAGYGVAGVGDVDSDGYHDILIGAPWNGAGGKGQIYLVLGRATGWSNNSNLTDADASFLGEMGGDLAGMTMSPGPGDVNGDGHDDILLGVKNNDEHGTDTGKVYLIFPEYNFGPKIVYSVKTYSDPGCNSLITLAEVGDTIYVELLGQDENATNIDMASVNVSITTRPSDLIRIYLVETGFGTGEYRGNFKISNRTISGQRLINANVGDYIKIASVTDPSKSTLLEVSVSIQIRPLFDKTNAVEDDLYYMTYHAIGYNTVSSWTFNSNATWLSWDDSEHNISGTPDNGDVGLCWATLNITDGLGNYDEHNFTINVSNTPPNITTENVIIALEDELYSVDYTSTDDGHGTITWHLKTNASWLSLNNDTGELRGTPTNDERGKYWVNVSVDDGNGGQNWSMFEITVIDTNDPPIILYENITTAVEEEFFSVDFNATDIDGDVTFQWYLDTNASWLSIEKASGIISGTPQNDDVGISYFNITVEDSRGGNCSQNYTIEVLNTNDPPEWEVEPKDTTVNEGEVYTFDVNATDMDKGDVLTYIISSDPITDIIINSSTGVIEWNASIGALGDANSLRVIVTVTDGDEYLFSYFDITVIKNLPPTTTLISPIKNSIVSASGVELRWEGDDVEDDLLSYNVYVSKDPFSITSLLESARIIQNTNETSYYVDNLVIGDLYYWSVIPFDGLSFGSCTDDMFVFLVNTPPTISSIPIQTTMVGTKFEYELIVTDLNEEDAGKLVYSLDSAPEGMSIVPTSGLITWTPTKEQVGKHMVKVQVSDGKDATNRTFEIEVTKSESEPKASAGNQSLIIAVIVVIIIIIVLILAIIILKKRKKLLTPDVEYIPPGSVKDMLPAGATAKPGAITAPSMIIDQVAPAQETQMQPSSASVPGKTPAIPKPVVTPTPQLPPATTEAEKPETKPESTTLEAGVVPIPAPTPAPVHVTAVAPGPSAAVDEQVETDFAIEGGPKPVEKEAVEHDVAAERVIEETDIGAATADLQAAAVVEPTAEGAVVHDADTTIWRPDEKGKVEENKEVLEQLKTLAELKDKGALTEEEFEIKKKELLDKVN